MKINEFIYPFVKLLKHEHKAKRLDVEKLNALTKLLLGDNVDPGIEKQTHRKPDDIDEIDQDT